MVATRRKELRNGKEDKEMRGEKGEENKDGGGAAKETRGVKTKGKR